jgi:ubiquinone/menaquinone biosynthesis C-methylase UbiE
LSTSDALGYSATTIQMMAGRHASGNARFFLPHLRSDMHVLDCGCGPGSITIDFAEVVASGAVVGIDLAPSHIAWARAQAAQRGITNVRFAVGDILHLPFPDATFDAVFGHTILIQLPNPFSVLTEVYRVVKSGGLSSGSGNRPLMATSMNRRKGRANSSSRSSSAGSSTPGVICWWDDAWGA